MRGRLCGASWAATWSANSLSDGGDPLVQQHRGHRPHTGGDELGLHVGDMRPEVGKILRKSDAPRGDFQRPAEDELPDDLIAARLLDHFGDTVSATAWLDNLSLKWSRKKYRPDGYGIFVTELEKYRTSYLIDRYGLRSSDTPVTLPLPLPVGRAKSFKSGVPKATVKDWKIEPEPELEVANILPGDA